MERKVIAPSSKMFGVASGNAGVHFQLEVNVVIMCLPCQENLPSLSCFLLRLDFVHFRIFPVPPFLVLTWPALSCSDLLYSQALLRWLQRGCAHVCVGICLSACVCLRTCLP
jgi:hypothetical protein